MAQEQPNQSGERATAERRSTKAIEIALGRVQFTSTASRSELEQLENRGIAQPDQLHPERHSLSVEGLARWNAIPRERRVEIGKLVRS